VCRGCEPWEEVTRTHYTQYTGTYHDAVFAREFVKVGRLGRTVFVGTTSFVAKVEDFKVIAINIIADKDIGEEFQERGFADTSLSNQKDGVVRLNFVLRSHDDPLLERLYVT